MKRTIAIIISVIMLATGMLSLSGCGITKTTFYEPLSLSIIIGAHKNFPQITASNTELYDLIYEACISYGNVSTVVADGSPTTKANYNILTVGKDITESKEKSIATQNANTIFAECINVSASIPEVDTLSAMKVSANALQATEPIRKVMCIYDNGICTTGLISQLSGDVINSSHEMVVNELSKLHALPDLTGIEVQWIGLGCTAGEQSVVPDSYQYKLKALWTAIIEASGGTVTFDTTPICGDEKENLPSVSPVSFAQDFLNIDYSTPKVLSEPIVFNESTVKFLGDRADFVDRDAAIEVLKPVAAILVENPELHIIIAGTTASAGSIEGCLELSMRRAEACKNVLLEYGASEDQIECIGLGRADNCFRVNDLNADGSLNEEMAVLNRAIYIFAADSDTAVTILN